MLLPVWISDLERDVNLIPEYEKCVLNSIPPELHQHGTYANFCTQMGIIKRIRNVTLYQIGRLDCSINSPEDQVALKKLPDLRATFEAWEQRVQQAVRPYDPATFVCLVRTHQASSQCPKRPDTLGLYQQFRKSKDTEERKALREEIWKLHYAFLIANEAWEGKGYNPYSIRCNADMMTQL